MKNAVIRIEDKLGSIPFFISRLHEEIKRTSPHIHEEYFEIVFLLEGEGFHWIEDEKYTLSAPEFYFLKPGQLHNWEFVSTPKGHVILFKASYFDPIQECISTNLISKLSDTFKIPIINHSSPRFILDEILYEFEENHPHSENIIHGYMSALFGKMLQFSSIHEKRQNVPLSLYHRFLDLIHTKCPHVHTVIDFAEMLNTTPRSINTACIKNSGKTAGKHIASKILLDAKRYVLNTEKTMSEIAQMLYFNDTSYFVKFFRKQEGMTPIQFRNNHK